MEDRISLRRGFSRRATLKLIGGAGAATVVGWRSGLFDLNRTSRVASIVSAETFDCVAKPALTEGPYFVDERLNRSDIRSDPISGVMKPGARLDLAFRLHRLESGACTPLAGAYVDVWHCDASGKYSDESANNTSGQKYLRGYQMTDEGGLAAFTTIYPGWYSGRAVHIHFKVRLFNGDQTAYEFTSQLFFEDAQTAEVYAASPYVSRGTPDTTNSRDGIYRGGGSELVLEVSSTANGYAATFDIGLEGVPASPGGGGGDTTSPTIEGALTKQRKLVVTGSGFDAGAVILVDGAVIATRNNTANPSTVLVAPKAAKSIARGQTVTLQVQNSNGAVSNEFAFARPAAQN